MTHWRRMVRGSLVTLHHDPTFGKWRYQYRVGPLVLIEPVDDVAKMLASLDTCGIVYVRRADITAYPNESEPLL